MQPVPLTDQDAWRREQILNENCFGKFSEENPDMNDEKYLPRDSTRPQPETNLLAA